MKKVLVPRDWHWHKLIQLKNLWKGNLRQQSKCQRNVKGNTCHPETLRQHTQSHAMKTAPWGRIHGAAITEIKELIRQFMYQSRIPCQKLLSRSFKWHSTSEEFLVQWGRCLDQNNYESLHHVVWGMAPKEQYTLQQETSLAVSMGVLVFNNVMNDTVSKLLESMDIPASHAKTMGTKWFNVPGWVWL